MVVCDLLTSLTSLALVQWYKDDSCNVATPLSVPSTTNATILRTVNSMALFKDRTIPWAPVQRWNACTVSVQCPFCTKIHTHGFGDSYDSIIRAAHCDHGSSLSFPSYRFAYPFSTREGTVAYEIEKSVGCFVALGTKAIDPEVENLEKALAEVNLDVDHSQDSRRWEHATEMITIGMEDETFRHLHKAFGGEDTFTLKRLDHVVSRMIAFGDSEYVEDYLHTSPEASLFLHGIDEEGKSALSLAACEKYPAIIKLLLDHGAKPDHQNKDGRTPLMEAALWGRIDNVRYLLEHGADRKLRDIHGHRASDLAESSPQNDEERYWRSGGNVQVYRENTFIANQARNVIFELLKDSKSPCRATPTGERAFEAHSFQNTGRGTIQLIAPIEEFHVRNEWKTVASLQRPSNFPSVAATSGWSHGETKVTVSGKEWTAEVMRISSTVGHPLPIEERRDQGKEGQYFASHAEKQLVAFFINKHVLIEAEDDELLQRVKPPVLLEKATILVSRPPCGDCLQFIKTVNTALGLIITVLDRSEK